MQLERFPGLRQLPSVLRRPDDGLVLFESWRGKYADNPRAIAERLHERRPELHQIWVVDEPAEPLLPAWATPVRPGSRAYLAALGRARHVVANTHLPRYFRKRPGSVYVQTWHGTPLKRIGGDIPPQGALGARYLDLMRNDVGKWDLLLSPNAFSTPIFRAAFAYDGPIVESGYPRNDLLASPAAADVRRTVRSALGLADGTLAILYAPTWRDGVPFTMELDLERLAARLGGDHVVLVRLHPTVAAGVPPAPNALDVSGHEDIRELYLAADVLVTDYSSAMFDFAVTGKPMLFYTYDLAAYRDEIRGFYFDFEQDAPGPLLADSDEVAEALADLDRVASAHAAAYAAFAERFCALEDGAAADRVVETVFAD